MKTIKHNKVCQFCQNWLKKAFLPKTPYNGCAEAVSRLSEMSGADGNDGSCTGIQNVGGECPKSPTCPTCPTCLTCPTSRLGQKYYQLTKILTGQPIENGKLRI